jgi:hypothetical protein
MAESAPYLRPTRYFQTAAFTVSHGQLILRSDPSYLDAAKTRAEVYFGNVQFLVVATAFEGLHLRRAGAAETARLREIYGDDVRDWERVFLLNERGSQFIVSSTPTWREGVRAIDDPSFFTFDVPWPQRPGDTQGEI